MSDESNSHIVRITGTAEASHVLEFGQEYRLNLTAQVNKISKDDNEDGTYDFVYSLKLIACELVDAQGKATKLKDKSKSSVKMRRAIEALRLSYAPTEDSEEFYKRAMGAMTDFENLEPYLKSLKII